MSITPRRVSRPRDGRAWTYLGMTLGGTISVYANIAEKYVDTPDPALDGVLLAAAAPVAVWVMLEILIRVRGRGVRATAARVSAAVVALVAFLTSFQHLHGLLLARGESALTAWTYPFGIDGLLIGAAAVLWQIRAEAGQAEATAPEARQAEAEGRAEAEAEGRAAAPEAMPGAGPIAPEARQGRAEPAPEAGQEAGPGQGRATAPVTPAPRAGQGRATAPEAAPGQAAAARQGRPRATLQVTPQGNEATRQVTVQDLEAAAEAGQVRPTRRTEVKAHFKIGSDRASELIKEYRERNEPQDQEQESQ